MLGLENEKPCGDHRIYYGSIREDEKFLGSKFLQFPGIVTKNN